MAAGNNLTVGMRRHPRGWLLVRFVLTTAGPIPWHLDLMLNTGRPQSALSRRTYATLAAFGHVTPLDGSTFSIRGARLGDTLLPSIPMRLSAGPALLGLEGMLGLDFLEQFAEARLDFTSPRLTLVSR